MNEAATYCDTTPHTGFAIHRMQNGHFIAVVDVIEQPEGQMQMDFSKEAGK